MPRKRISRVRDKRRKPEEQKEVNEVYRNFRNSVNMTERELREWRDDPRSRKASLSREPINDVIRLLDTPKRNWSNKEDGFNEIKEAKEVISFNARMSKVNEGEHVAEPNLSKQDISLANWGRRDSDVPKDFWQDKYL